MRSDTIIAIRDRDLIRTDSSRCVPVGVSKTDTMCCGSLRLLARLFCDCGHDCVTEEFFFYSIEFLVIKSEFLVNKSEFLVNKSEFLVMKSEYRV